VQIVNCLLLRLLTSHL